MGAENHRHLFQQVSWARNQLSSEVVGMLGLPLPNPKYNNPWTKDGLCDGCHFIVVYTGDLSATNQAIAKGFPSVENPSGAPPLIKTGIIIDFTLLRDTNDGIFR